MEAQEIRYRVNKKVFRQASLYAMFLRNRNTFRVGIAVVLAVAFYTVLAVQGTFPLSYLPIYIAAAYLVWMLLLLGREEQRVLRYLKSDESLLGTEYVLRFDAGKLSVEILSNPRRPFWTAITSSTSPTGNCWKKAVSPGKRCWSSGSSSCSGN